MFGNADGRRETVFKNKKTTSQMITINQINGRTAQSATIQLYLNTDRDHWRARSFDFKFEFKGKEDKRRLSILGNFTFGAAMREHARVNGRNEYNYNYERDHRSEHTEIEFNGSKLQFSLRIENDLQGVRLWVETNFSAFPRFIPFVVRSNQTFAALNIAEYFEKMILPKYLYAPGLFRNIQIIWNLSKEEARKKYAEIMKQREPAYIDTDKAISRQLRRKKNITLADGLSEKTCLNMLRTYDRQKRKVKAFKSPSVFELSEMYANEYDTDEQAESFVNEYFNEYPKNAIFI